MLPPRDESRSIKWLGYLLLLFPLVMILPGLADFPYPSGDASYSDITISHYPAAVTLKRLILVYRQLPLWSPHLLSGAPLAANPLYSLYYPPSWLGLFLPLPAGFNLLVILHLAWGGLGILRLLQADVRAVHRGRVAAGAEVQVHDAVGAPGGEHQRERAENRVPEPLVGREAVGEFLQHGQYGPAFRAGAGN